MFGNPNISTTPVDDLYRSQADTYGNSFANPVNPANMNPGWGIDSSLLSPSYTAGFRPSYGGPNGAVAGGRPGFFSGLNNTAPWATTPNWGNPIDHQQSSIDSVGSRPVDAGMWAAQRIAMPVAAIWGAGKAFGGYNSWGMGKGAASMGRNLGRGFGGGLARGLGASSGGVMARGLSSAMGGVMGAAAGWALPIAAAQGAMWAGEKTMFDPYINSRRGAEDLRDNFGGITFGDSQGNVSSGGGLSGVESARMGRRLSTAGIKDMSMSTGQFTEAAGMIGRSGLADNVNSKDIVKRIQESTQQMKLIMSIANMPEMKDAIEQLSKLQKMGANVSGGSYSDAAGTMRQLGGLASVAGTNVQKLMNTVGAQGQYLYQANGMTPYLGQIAAANNYASLSAGNRQGLISSAQLARLGGLDGAAQASMTGELNASQTTYNKIGNYNRYMGAGAGGGAIGTLQKFGQSMVRDPMGVQGAMMLYGNQMAGTQMNERGSLALDDQVWDMLKNMPGMVDPKTGKISLEKAVPFLNQMGMSTEQIQAYASKRVSETDQGTYEASLKGLNRNHMEQQRQLVEQNTLYGGVIGRTAHSAMKAGRGFTAAVGDAIGGSASSGVGSLSDGYTRLKDKLWYGDTIKTNSQTVEEALSGTDSNKDILGFKVSMFGNSSKEPIKNVKKYSNARLVAHQLNEAKDRGDPNAIAYFKATDAKGRQAAINKFKEAGGFSKQVDDYLSKPENYKTIEADLNGITRQTTKDTEDGILGQTVKNMLGAVGLEDLYNEKPVVSEKGGDILARVGGLKGGDVADNARIAGRAYLAATSGKELTTSNIEERMKTDENLQEIAKAQGITNPQDLLAYVRKTAKGVADEQIVGLTTNSLKVKGKGVDALKAAGARNGGTFYDENAINTKHLDYDETMAATMATKERALMTGQLQDKLKSGHLDFTGYQNSMNALDNKESVDKFVKGVDTFAKAAGVIAEGADKKEKGFFSGIFSSNKDGTENQKSNTSGR